MFQWARAAIFVDGCFWHGCPKHGTTPKTNLEYWGPKLRRNQERERQGDEELRAMDWLPLRLWEHEIENPADGAAYYVSALIGSRVLSKSCGKRIPEL